MRLPKIKAYIPLFGFIVAMWCQIFSIVLAEDISSTSFKIEGDNMSAGSGTADSTSYSMTADVNPFSDLSDSSSFKQKLGYNPRIQAYTPYAPTLDNPSDYYDRLRLILDPSGNPSDTVFAVIVSDDDFSTYEYLQSDNGLDDTLGAEDYRTYTELGGASGLSILGLKPGTVYKAKVKALNGDFTETGYGPESSEAETTVPFINFQMDTDALTMGVLNVSSISQTTSVTVTVNTNAMTGYQMYVSDTGNGASGGLYDGIANLIASSDVVLFPGTAGYGAQASSLSGTIDSKYDVSGNQVGALEIGTNPLVSNSAAVSAEETTVLFKATISASTVAGDYSDTVYFTITPSL